VRNLTLLKGQSGPTQTTGQEAETSRPSETHSEKKAPLVVCIDPGHPSEVGLGTRGKRISEMEVVWQIGGRLKKRLEAEGFRVVLTKSALKQKVVNRERAAIANRAKAALMVRLHCDSTTQRGLATYAPNRTGVSGGVRGPSREVIRRSQLALKIFHPALIKHLNGLLADRGMHPDTETAVGKKQGALTGSIFSEVPVVLVELCNLTNAQDEAIVRDPKHQERIADALCRAVQETIVGIPVS
jgi:N-acetylmuramoyl-L-alanine amidase